MKSSDITGGKYKKALETSHSSDGRRKCLTKKSGYNIQLPLYEGFPWGWN
jgi:hypothetical protein